VKWVDEMGWGIEWVSGWLVGWMLLVGGGVDMLRGGLKRIANRRLHKLSVAFAVCTYDLHLAWTSDLERSCLGD